MARKIERLRLCKWCGTVLDTNRKKGTQFCSASHRSMFWRRGHVVMERTERAEKAIDRLASLLSFDETNIGATKYLKWLKQHIEFYLENGWQNELPGVENVK